MFKKLTFAKETNEIGILCTIREICGRCESYCEFECYTARDIM